MIQLPQCKPTNARNYSESQ